MDNLKSPKSTIQIIKETFHLYSLLFKKLMPTSFLLAILLASLRYDFLDSAAGQSRGFLLFIIVTLCTAVLGFLFASILLVIIDRNEANIGLKYAFNLCAGIIEQIILATLLVGLMITIGTLLLVLPGIYLGFALLFVLPILVLEKKSAIEAIKLSLKLTKGRWWYIALSYFLTLLIPFIPLMAIKIIAFWFLPGVIDELIFIAVKTLMFPYLTILIYVLYKELKRLSTHN